MTNYLPGEIVLVAFPFSGGQSAVIRPALVILDSGDADVLMARVTTQLYSTSFDVPIKDWRGAGLLASSVVRLHKLATLEKNLIHKRLGALLPADKAAVSSIMRQTYSTW